MRKIVGGNCQGLAEVRGVYRLNIVQVMQINSNCSRRTLESFKQESEVFCFCF